MKMQQPTILGYKGEQGLPAETVLAKRKAAQCLLAWLADKLALVLPQMKWELPWAKSASRP